MLTKAQLGSFISQLLLHELLLLCNEQSHSVIKHTVYYLFFSFFFLGYSQTGGQLKHSSLFWGHLAAPGLASGDGRRQALPVLTCRQPPLPVTLTVSFQLEDGVDVARIQQQPFFRP